MNRNEIKERRICLNEEEIRKSQQRRFRYKVIQCSIAAAALFSSSYAYISYRLAPVDGVIFYGETEILPDSLGISYEDEIMLPNGRYVTGDGANKEYLTKSYMMNDGVVSHPYMRVSLPAVAREVDTNHMILRDKVKLNDNTYVYVRTVPTEAESVKSKSVISLSLVTGLLSGLFLKSKIDDAIFYEKSLKIKNRKLKRSLR